jgi:D-xylose transport system permease protein
VSSVTDDPRVSVGGPGPISARQRGRQLVEGLAGPYRIATVAITLALIWVFFYLNDDNGVFLSARNLSNLSLQITVMGFVALGLVFVLLLGEIDLSVAAISGTTAAIMAALYVQNDVAPWIAVAAALAAGAALEFCVGVVTVFGPPSFIVSLGAQLIISGMLLRILPKVGQLNLTDTPLAKIASTYIPTVAAVVVTVILVIVYALMRWSTWIRHRSRGGSSGLAALLVPTIGVAVGAALGLSVFARYRGVPLPFALFLGVLLVSSYFLTQTRFGTYVYAVGGNREAARRAGIPVTRVIVISFMICGVMAAVGGVIAASRLLGVSNQSGSGSLLLQAIAAAVVGGVSLLGGRGSVWAALLGAFVIGSISNGMDLLEYSTSAKLIVQGALLVVAVVVDAVIARGSLRPSRGG